MTAVQRALISVSDKTGLLELARALQWHHVEILSTGGTYRTLCGAGIPATEIAAYTGAPEIMDGRVKTLHPKIYGGILGMRGNPVHVKQMQLYLMPPIDLVVVNLYPFAQTVAKPGVKLEEAVEQIDIGGPSLIRAAAKNHADVTILTEPGDYARAIELLDANRGSFPEEFRRRMMVKAYAHTAKYDGMIADYFSRHYGGADAAPLPRYERAQVLRYGENPHQQAALLRDAGGNAGIAAARQLHGKELSYNNILDADAALRLLRECAEPAAVVIKHNNPCGMAADAADIAAAFENAYAGDSMSAYGGIVGLNRAVDAALARVIANPGKFLEVILAPDFSPEAVEILTTQNKWGKNVRLLAVGPVEAWPTMPPPEIRSILGGALLQDLDVSLYNRDELRVVSRRTPTDAERRDLELAWKIAKHAKSNAIALVKDGMLVGLGTGQMSRVDSGDIAVRKAGDRVRGAAAASDGFFPFRDTIDALAKAGITAVIHPGGSIRDAEVTQAADEHDMTMMITGQRHFKH